MKSKASIKSHPIHPMMIAFPVAFFIGTLLFDVLGYLLQKEHLRLVAYYLNIAAVITALLAAVPGFIDYLYTVPPNSSAKSRATKHALINVTNVIIFAIAWLLKRNPDVNMLLMIILEFAGCILLSVAGWMGGTLVYRNQIGVDPRYAYAGKWNEEFIETKSEKIFVADPNELKVDQMKLVHIKDKRIVIARSEKGYAAFDDRCSHKGGSLAGGAMICGTVQCPWHGSQFDVHNGSVKAGPAKASILTYEVREEGGKIFLIL